MAATVEKPRRHRGRPLSEEHRAKLREAAIARWAAAPAPSRSTSTLPCVRLRLSLASARRAGATFAEAWPAALETAVADTGQARRGWIEVLTEHRPVWASAYRHDEGQACWSALEYSRI